MTTNNEHEIDRWALADALAEPRDDARRERWSRREREYSRRRFVWLWALPALLCIVGYVLVAAAWPGGWNAGLLLLGGGLGLIVAGLLIEGRRF